MGFSVEALLKCAMLTSMNDTELYRTLLGVEAPWFVANVELNLEDEAVYVTLDFDGRTANFDCPECRKQANLYDRRETRTWRHLDSCQFKTYLRASIPRVCCKMHGILTAPVFWAEPGSHYTKMFEHLALRVLQATQVQARAAHLLRLTPGQIHDMMQRAVTRGLQRRDTSQTLEQLSIDEKSFQEGHKYVTILSDPLEKRVLDLVEGRTQEATEELLKSSLTLQQRENVASVSMDMWPAFMNARETLLPKADTVHDRYHIAAYLNEAVDKTRRAENRELTRLEDSTLHKSKYLWLRSDENMTDKQRSALAALTCLELETAKVWAFKESFRQFFGCQTEYGARSFFYAWRDAAFALGNVHLTKVAQMLDRHLEGLAAYIRHRVTNATAEGLNAQIQQIKSNAKGFRKWENFRVAILFFLGKLDLYPQETP
jgi:transposase